MMGARILIGLLCVSAAVLPAQSTPPIMKPKEAATRAVAATNAHTDAMTREPGAAVAQPASRPAPARDSASRSEPTRETAAGSAAVPKSVENEGPKFEREVFSYAPSGRRDPFVSLMTSGDLRPVITDLYVAGIVFDDSGRNSVAILVDGSSKEQYRARVGMSLGRMRVARIDPKSVTFTIEEFGFSRQETLPLGDPNKVRKQ